MLLQVKGLIQINVKFRTEKKLCTFLLSTRHPFQRHEILGIKYRLAILWKGTTWKFIFLWTKINRHVLQITKAHFSYTICLMISEKKYYYVHFSRPWWCTNVPDVSANQAHTKKNYLPEFPVLVALNNYLHVYLCFL